MKQKHCCACHDADCEKEHINGAFKWCEMHLEGGRALGIVPKQRVQAPVDVRTAQQMGPNQILGMPGMMVQLRGQQGPQDVKSAQDDAYHGAMLQQQLLAARQQQAYGYQSFQSAQQALIGSWNHFVGSGIMQTAVHVNTSPQTELQRAYAELEAKYKKKVEALERELQETE